MASGSGAGASGSGAGPGSSSSSLSLSAMVFRFPLGRGFCVTGLGVSAAFFGAGLAGLGVSAFFFGNLQHEPGDSNACASEPRRGATGLIMHPVAVPLTPSPRSA